MQRIYSFGLLSTAMLCLLSTFPALGLAASKATADNAKSEPNVERETEKLKKPSPHKQYGEELFSQVVKKAQHMATKPYKEWNRKLPKSLQNLTYDQYRDIRFKPSQSLWRAEKLQFEVQFFFRAFIFDKGVKINIIDGDQITAFPYTNDLFDFGKNKIPGDLPENLGFAGFRLHYPLHGKEYYDEVAVFLGASYFRAVGQNQNYGISLRGLAIDTGLPKKEEFPVFSEFWLIKPAPDAHHITLFALLNSPSITGAYQFTIIPGAATRMDVHAELFARAQIEKLGIAPLTSMFLHGDLKTNLVDDYRPEVHDSEGLLIASGNGEWLWRPLDNSSKLRISSFQTTNPKGFGLLQRDRNFDHYQDLESNYHRRPSAWVIPRGDWGDGRVELVEIPSDSEKYDNIVAFWVPAQPITAGSKLSIDYQLSLELDGAGNPPAGKTVASRTGAGGNVDLNPSIRKFVLDFAGGPMDKLDPATEVEAVISASEGKIVNQFVQYNPISRTWRTSFELLPKNADTVELRCFLKHNDDILTETWSYQWNR